MHTNSTTPAAIAAPIERRLRTTATSNETANAIGKSGEIAGTASAATENVAEAASSRLPVRHARTQPYAICTNMTAITRREQRYSWARRMVGTGHTSASR